MLATPLTFGHRVRWIYPVFLLLAVSAVIVLALQSYREIDRKLTDAALARRSSVSYLAATTIAERFDHLTDIGVSLATRVRFRELIEAGKWAEASKILTSVPQDFRTIDRLALMDPAGNLMADVPEDPQVRGKNFAYRDYFTGVSRNWEPYISQAYKRDALPQIIVLAAAIPIKDKSRQTLGVLVLQVPLESFFAWTKNIDLGPGGFVYIVDRQGHVAFHPNFRLQEGPIDFSTVPVVKQVLQGRRGVEINFNPVENEERISAYAPVSNYGWGVIAQQPTASAFAEKNIQLRRVLIAYAIVLSLGLSLLLLTPQMLIQRREADKQREVAVELERRVAERTDELANTAEKLREKNIELENASLAKDRFLASMSHELRTPLNAIIGFTGTLLMRLPGPLNADQEKQLKTIQSSARHQLALINDLLDLAKIEAGKVELHLEPVDCRGLVEEAAASLRTEAACKALAFEVIVPEEGCVIRADRRALHQIVINLANNAIKYTDSGRVTIEVARRNEDGRVLTEVSVQDTGVGIKPEDQSKLFLAFQQLDNSSTRRHEGTGLGLYLSQKLAQLLGGRISVRSEFGKGSVFTLTLEEK